MSHVIDEIKSILARSTPVQPAAGPLDVAPQASTALSVLGAAPALLRGAITTVEADFALLSSAPAALRARISQAAARIRAAQAEVDRIVSTVEADVESQVAAARTLVSSLSAAQSAAATEIADLSDERDALVSAATSAAVQGSLAKLGNGAPSPADATTVVVATTTKAA